MQITPEALTGRGYAEVQPNVFVRMTAAGGRMRGVAVVFRADGLFFAGADYDLSKAKLLLGQLAKIFARDELVPIKRGPALLSSSPSSTPPASAKKQKAERILQALLLTGLEGAPSEVGAAQAHEFDAVVESLVGAVQAERAARRENRQKRRAAFRKVAQSRRDKFRQSLHRLAKKVAGSKIMTKLREGYAKILRGPIGKGAAKLVATALQIFGVPRKATETAILAHHERKASRLAEGGWAGTLARATEHRGAWKEELKHEGERFGKSFKKGAQQAGIVRGTQQGIVSGVPLDAVAVLQHGAPRYGIGSHYQLGAMAC